MLRSRVLLLGFMMLVLAIHTQVAQAVPSFAGGRLSLVVNDSQDLPDFAINGVCDATDGGGQCTLRAALDEVNAAGGGWHLIRIGALNIGLSTQYGALAVKPGVRVLIAGAGTARTVVDGGGYSGTRIFAVEHDAWLFIRYMTLANGSNSCCGGGIYNNGGHVDVFQCVLSGHYASASGMGGDPGRGGAIFNTAGGSVTVTNSTFSNNLVRSSGGAIRNEGQLLVLNSTFDHNTGYAGGGGAIYNKGNAAIFSSTFSGNNSAGAGAITNSEGGQMTIFSSTFAYNYTSSNVPWFTLSNAMAGSVLRVSNTLVYSTQPGTNCDGQITSLGYNLSNDSSCGFTRRGDQHGADPKLGPLADNGGPTQTHALLSGSAALDKGFCFGVDQRGYRRPVNLPFVPNAGNTCDIGAFEVQR